MVFKQVIIFGAGSVGSYLGAFLSEKIDTLLVGSEKHVQAIKSQGLKLSGSTNNTFQVQAENQLKEIGEKALVIVAVKNLDLEETLQELKLKLKKDSVVLLVQNGLGVQEIAEAVGVKAFRGILHFGTEMRAPGEVFAWVGDKAIVVLPDTAIGKEIAGLFNDSNLKTKAADDFPQAVWRKLIVNCLINPLSALINEPNGKVFDPELKPLRQEIFNECSAVAEAEGIDLGDFQLERLEKTFRKSKNYSSMAQDIQHHKKTEIDFLNGKIVELAKKHGLDVPFNKKMVLLVKEMETVKCKTCLR